VAGVVARGAPAGFWLLELIVELPEAAGPVLPLFGTPPLMFCRSSLLSSAVVFRPLFGAFGATTDDFLLAGIADFGVSGLVAALRESELDLPEDDPLLEFCAVATPIPAITVTNKHAILCFIMANSRSGLPFQLPY
jgi:hypothetical protein